MDNSKLVSVIIPVYNVAPYLQEALDSVIHQTYNNIEIIIIDDGSTDGSGEICDEYAGRDPRIYVIHQENRGLSAARNAGLDAMKGDSVAFLDSDDAYCLDFIESMVNAMNQGNVEIVACKCINCRTTGNMSEIKDEKEKPAAREVIYNREEALRALADYRLNHGIWNKIYRKELWNEIRFPEGDVYEDIAVTYQLIDRCRKVYILDRPLYMYRKRPGSISEIKTAKNISDYFAAYSHFEEFIRTHIPEVYTDEQLNKFCRKIFGLRIKRYIQLSLCSNPDNEEFRTELRKQIIETGEQIDIQKCNRHTRIYYWIITYCPCALVSLYFTYHLFKKLFRK